MIGMLLRVNCIAISIVIGMLFYGTTVYAGGIAVVACCNSHGACPYKINDTWVDTYNGTSYSCRCTSSGGSCTPDGGSGGSGSSGGGGGHGSKDAWKYQIIQDVLNSAMKQNTGKAVYSPDIGMSKADADKLKQQKLRSKQEAERKFQIESGELSNGLKGGTSPLMKGTADTVVSSPPRSEAVQKTEKVLKELSCSAYWGVKALNEPITVGVTKDLNDSFSISSRYAQNSAMAKGAEPSGECPEIVMNIPDAPLPIESDPQIQAYAYIVKKAEILLPQMVQTRQKIAKTDRQIETLKKEKKVKKDTQSDEAKKKADDELKREALELEKQTKEASELEVMYNDISSNPEHAEKWMRKVK